MRSEHLAAGLVLVAVGVLACLAPIQSDTWWLLRAGEEIWSTGRVPLIDTYSHTAAGRYWWNHEWLTEVLFYGAWRVGALPALVFLSASALFLAWLFVWRLMWGAFERRFVLYLACLPAAAGSFAVRPQAFSMLLFATVCWLLAGERRWRWVPLVILLWINLHGAAVLGLVAIAGAGAAETVLRRRLPWRLILVFALSFLATGLTPVGFRLYPEIQASVERSAINQLIEWLPPGAALWLWPFWALVAAVPVTIVLRRRHMDDGTARWLGIALAMLPLAVRSTRNVHIFLMAALPAIAGAWSGPARVMARPRERERLNAALFGGVAIAAAIFVGLTWRRPLPPMGWHPISADAARAIDSCAAPLYNTYGDGGVLIWFARQQPVFIDNRQDPYPTDLLRLNKALELSGQYDDVFSRYGVRCAALPPQSPLVPRLDADPKWAVRFADAGWRIYVKKQ